MNGVGMYGGAPRVERGGLHSSSREDRRRFETERNQRAVGDGLASVPRGGGKGGFKDRRKACCTGPVEIKKKKKKRGEGKKGSRSVRREGRRTTAVGTRHSFWET